MQLRKIASILVQLGSLEILSRLSALEKLLVTAVSLKFSNASSAETCCHCVVGCEGDRMSLRTCGGAVYVHIHNILCKVLQSLTVMAILHRSLRTETELAFE